MIIVRELKDVSQSAAEQLAALGSSLHGYERGFSEEQLQEIVDDPHIALVVAQDNDRIIGMGGLYIIVKIGKRKGYIEDLIVDEKYRGQGLGEQIMRELIRTARNQGLYSLALNTNPKRVAAHKLYEKVGFKQIEEYVFMLAL
ncbi:MAG TPA: GNAT family N-acetyltransferase [Candidatus Paceibacterota bacterium]|nr:GNAT family N-acetyltransferase [Candidatus Paceibacterota bacterium]